MKGSGGTDMPKGKAKPDGKMLEGKVAMVTGAARGMGKAIATRLSGAGAKLVIADIDHTGAKAMAEGLALATGDAVAVSLDVTDEKSVQAMVAMAMEAYGRVDILVNNAGILFRTRFPKITLKEWRATMDVNLDGVFLCTKAVIPVMMKQKQGRIVNISSSAGRSVSTLGGAHYTASKAGVLGLTRAVAKEMAPHGITCNAICPGLIDTKMARDTTTPAEITGYINSFPIKRLGTPEEVGDLVVFLVSDRAAYITGASIDINGGDLMM
jgi:NAD(P)-dependent dehydrogenase (short-subunit alcohol dehydrogenase family)